MRNKDKISLYIHIPFCVRKCFYCDFLSFPMAECRGIKEKYIQSLIKEIKAISAFTADYSLYTVFIGGGTPSILGDDIRRICDAVNENFNEPVEFTMEVNPGTVVESKLHFDLIPSPKGRTILDRRINSDRDYAKASYIPVDGDDD
ncbi:MAG: hypothetical protein K6G11_04740, partial [Lachnospiraceae bacterium]|nr:hypothetical protein [Lachnospiraceae bacterium]